MFAGPVLATLLCYDDSIVIGRTQKNPHSTLSEGRGGSRALVARDALLLLRRGRELVASGWTQQALARSAAGRIVNPTSRSARRFCLVGALVRAEHELFGEEWEDVELAVAYDGSPAFVTALALLAASAALVIVHPREFAPDQMRRVWAGAALRASYRGILDAANDVRPRRKREMLEAYDLAIKLGATLETTWR